MKKRVFNRFFAGLLSFSLLLSEAAPLTVFAADDSVIADEGTSIGEEDVDDEILMGSPDQDEEVAEDVNGSSSWDTPPSGWTNKVASYTDSTDHIIYDLYLVSGEYKLFIYSDSDYNESDTAITKDNVKESGDVAAHWNEITEIAVNAVYKISKNYFFEQMTKLKTVDLCINTSVPTCWEIDASWLFYRCPALEEIKLPGMLKAIPDQFAYMCPNLKTVTIQDTVMGDRPLSGIGNLAFSVCPNLESFDFSKYPKLSTIGGGAFYGCSKLGKNSTLDFSSSTDMTEIGSSAFRETGYKTVKLPANKAVKCGGSAFADMKNLTDFYFGSKGYFDTNESAYVIPDNFLKGCENLTSVYGGSTGSEKNKLPQSGSFGYIIKDSAFEGCTHLGDGDSNFNLLSDVKKVEARGFANSGIKGTVSVKAVGDSAFEGCSGITKVTSCKTIGQKAFYGCDNLATVTLYSPQEIGNYAFADCTKLDDVSIQCPEDMSSVDWGKGIFTGCTRFSERTKFDENTKPRIVLSGKTAEELKEISWINDEDLLKEWIGTQIKSILCDGGYIVPATWENIPSLDCFSMDSMTLKKGTTLDFMLNYINSAADDPRIMVESNNPGVVEIVDFPSLDKQLDPQYLPTSVSIKAVDNGSATVTIKSVTGGLSDSCTITVTDAGDGHVWVSGVTDDTGDYSGAVPMYVGDTLQAKWSVAPANATNKAVRFESGDEDVLTISETGLITAVGTGTTSFYIISQENGYYKASHEVTVYNKIAVTGVEVTKTLELEIGKSSKLAVTVTPSDATNKKVSFESSAPEVAIVSDGGTVTAIAAGTATITVTAEDGGFTDTCTVTVAKSLVPVTGITIEPKTITLAVGESAELTATVAPENATNKEVTYISNAPDIAEVKTEEGKTGIYGKKAGTAVITATTTNGGFTAKCTVTVTASDEVIEVTGVTVDPKTLKLYAGETGKLTATVAPENATIKDVIWESDNTEILTVSADGTVTAISGNQVNNEKEDKLFGTATVTVTTVSGNKADTCTVSVYLKGTENPGPDDPIDPVDPILGDHTVSFYDGENILHKEVVTEGELVSMAPVIEKDEKTFAGWFNKEEGLFWTKDTPVYSDLTVFARFKNANGELEPIPGLDETTGYEFLAESAVGRDIYLVKGQKIFIKSDSVQSDDNKILSVSKAKNGAVTASAKKTGTISLTMMNVSGNVINHTVHINAPAFLPKTIKLETGMSTTIGLVVGSDTDKYDVVYTSSNPDVAVIDNGKVHGLSKGSAVITAHINGKKYNCKVKVTDPAAPGSIKDNDVVVMAPFQSFSLKFADKFNAKKAAWSVSDNGIVSIKNGKITANKPGIITVTGTGDKGVKTFTVVVTNPTVQTMHINAGKNKTVKFFKLNNKKAVWTVSDNKVATVTNGKITALSAGVTEVTAVAGDVSYKVYVIVEDPAVSTDSKLTPAGKKYGLGLNYRDAYFLTCGGTAQKVVFTSNKPDVARVDKNGQVIASGIGKAKLTAKVNGKTITVNVTVSE